MSKRKNLKTNSRLQLRQKRVQVILLAQVEFFLQAVARFADALGLHVQHGGDLAGVQVHAQKVRQA